MADETGARPAPDPDLGPVLGVDLGPDVGHGPDLVVPIDDLDDRRPEARLGVALVVALLLNVPTIGDAMSGGVEVSSVALRYLAALVLSWLAVELMVRLWHACSAAPAAAPSEAPEDVDG